MFGEKKPKILLHICCAGCGAHVSSELANDYRVILYFYNPNIFPEEEYYLRLAETERMAEHFQLELISEEYDHRQWLEKVAGFEKEPERLGVRYFTATLTVSPHKNAAVIIKIGRFLAEKLGLNFLDRDFKKKDGFRKSMALAEELKIYRQEYCGCEFSGRR
jgi:predicted adenine nucleotide alpha hydrolase (AANH) superfamily ATPase